MEFKIFQRGKGRWGEKMDGNGKRQMLRRRTNGCPN
jgi:hypothetical protein